MLTWVIWGQASNREKRSQDTGLGQKTTFHSEAVGAHESHPGNSLGNTDWAEDLAEWGQQGSWEEGVYAMVVLIYPAHRPLLETWSAYLRGVTVLLEDSPKKEVGREVTIDLMQCIQPPGEKGSNPSHELSQSSAIRAYMCCLTKNHKRLKDNVLREFKLPQCAWSLFQLRHLQHSPRGNCTSPLSWSSCGWPGARCSREEEALG